MPFISGKQAFLEILSQEGSKPLLSLPDRLLKWRSILPAARENIDPRSDFLKFLEIICETTALTEGFRQTAERHHQ